MISDLLGELAVEKIRKDFGDFTSTIFAVILYNGGCSMSQINFLIPRIDYSIVRSSILHLFQHNILYFMPLFSNLTEIKDCVNEIKILPRLHECIYRFRFARFICLAEHEYGTIGRKILELFFENGQVCLARMIGCRLSKNDLVKFQNILIQMARDGVIKAAFITFFIKNNNSFEAHRKTVRKPILIDKKTFWKISTLKLNITLRLNLILAFINDFYGDNFYLVLRYCACKILGFCTTTLNRVWFSLDTLIDWMRDFSHTKKNNELCITQVVSNFVLNDNSLRIHNSRIHIYLGDFFEIIAKKIIENLVGNQFGQTFLIIFKLLHRDLENDEKNIASECFVHSDLIRKELFKMYRLGFAFFEEKNFTSNVEKHRKYFVWKINFASVKKRFISEIIKCLYNILLKIEDFDLFFTKYFFFMMKDANRLENNYVDQRKGLNVSIQRLDELLLFIYS